MVCCRSYALRSNLKRVYVNVPDRSLCDREYPWGCDRWEIARTIRALQAHGVVVQSIKQDDIFIEHDDIVLRALYAFNGVDTPVGMTDVNDTSVILSLTHGAMRVLFPGDLNHPLGQYLAGQKDLRLRANLLKVPHHGTESVAPDIFFDWVNPELAVVPSSFGMFQSPRSLRIRNWLEIATRSEPM